MTLRSKLALGLAAAAMVVTPMTPAFARSYGWGAPGYGSGWGNRWRGRPYRRDNSGAVIGALLGVGIIAAIATSASKSNRDRDARNRTYRDDDYRDYRTDDSRYRTDDDQRSARDYDGRGAGTRYPAGTSTYGDEDAAVDACAMAARDEGSRDGRFAEVRDITDARRAVGGGYTVTGTLEQRSTFRAGSGTARGFSCSWSDGQTSVRLS